MNGKEILIKLPIVRMAALIVKLVRLSKGGLTKNECLELIEDLADIAAAIAQKLV